MRYDLSILFFFFFFLLFFTIDERSELEFKRDSHHRESKWNDCLARADRPDPIDPIALLCHVPYFVRNIAGNSMVGTTVVSSERKGQLTIYTYEFMQRVALTDVAFYSLDRARG